MILILILILILLLLLLIIIIVVIVICTNGYDNNNYNLPSGAPVVEHVHQPVRAVVLVVLGWHYLSKATLNIRIRSVFSLYLSCKFI